MNARRHLVVMLVVLNLAVLGPSAAIASRADVLPGASPLLYHASVSAESVGMVSVKGSNFTPGGKVFVAVYDQWGTQLFDNRWTSATETIHGLNGTQDPANGFIQGGRIDEDFGLFQEIFGPNGSQDPALGYVSTGTYSASLCGTEAMARAFDLGTETWSNVLDVSSSC